MACAHYGPQREADGSPPLGPDSVWGQAHWPCAVLQRNPPIASESCGAAAKLARPLVGAQADIRWDDERHMIMQARLHYSWHAAADAQKSVVYWNGS